MRRAERVGIEPRRAQSLVDRLAKRRAQRRDADPGVGRAGGANAQYLAMRIDQPAAAMAAPGVDSKEIRHARLPMAGL